MAEGMYVCAGKQFISFFLLDLKFIRMTFKQSGRGIEISKDFHVI
jgi:hypothetical protein